MAVPLLFCFFVFCQATLCVALSCQERDMGPHPNTHNDPAPLGCIHTHTYMKSVVTRWEPLAMALNSTPSRSMSLGRHHSSMFPATHTHKIIIIKHTCRLTNTDTGTDGKYIITISYHVHETTVRRSDWILWNSLCVGWAVTLEQQLSKYDLIGAGMQRRWLSLGGFQSNH